MVKDGYKLTDIGVIPNDWEVVTLPNITANTQNAIKIGPFGSALKRVVGQEWFKVYGQENIFDKDMTLGDRYLNLEHFIKLKSCEVKTGDFLISMMGTVGKCFVVPKNIQQGIIDSHLIRIRINEKKFDVYLLEFLVASKLVLSQINKLSVGGIMDGLSSKIIKQLLIPIPPLEEQKAIVRALSDADELIDSLQNLIDKKENIKLGTMQQLLTGKKRLKGFSDEWKEKYLSNIFDFKQGIQCSVNNQFLEEKENRKRFIRIVDITQKDEPLRYISDPGKKYHIQEEDLFMVRYGSPGLIGFGCKGIIANNLFRLIPKIKIYPLFFYYLLKFENKKIQETAVSTTMAALNFTALNNFKVSFSSEINEQKEIATILSDMDKEIEFLKEKLKKTKDIKEAMMDELLTGKTRLIKG